MGSNSCFHVWRARVAQFQCDPIEDPVQWMVLGEAFVNDEKKVLSQVCFNIQVPRRVVHIPCDITSSGFSPCLVLFWVEC